MVEVMVKDLSPTRESKRELSKAGRKKDRLREEAYDKQLGLCYYCKCELRTRTRGFRRYPFATLEHLIPRSKGGTYAKENIAVACPDCNSKRGSK